MIDKQQVARSFTRAASLYEEHATAQRTIAQRLMRYISACDPLSCGSVLEVGVGTGMLTRQICEELSPSRMTLNDLSKQMLELAEQDATTSLVCADAESYDFEGEFDLIASSSTIQWFERPDRFIQRMCERLKTGGVLAISSFGEQNFKQIRELTNRGLKYYTTEDYAAMLPDTMELKTLCEEQITLHFKSTKELMTHLRDSGVNGTEPRLSVAQTRKFLSEYTKHFSSEEGLALTYHPIYIVATKR